MIGADSFLNLQGKFSMHAKNALNKLDIEIATKNNGIIQLDSGGPVFHAILTKYTNDYYSGILTTYSGVDLTPIYFKRSQSNYSATYI